MFLSSRHIGTKSTKCTCHTPFNLRPKPHFFCKPGVTYSSPLITIPVPIKHHLLTRLCKRVHLIAMSVSFFACVRLHFCHYPIAVSSKIFLPFLKFLSFGLAQWGRLVHGIVAMDVSLWQVEFPWSTDCTTSWSDRNPEQDVPAFCIWLLYPYPFPVNGKVIASKYTGIPCLLVYRISFNYYILRFLFWQTWATATV